MLMCAIVVNMQSVVRMHEAHTPGVGTLADKQPLTTEDSCAPVQEVFYSRRGYVIPKRERERIDATGGSHTYGEVRNLGR